MYLDLRYDIGKQERFFNSPVGRKALRKVTFGFFIVLIKKKLKGV